VEQVHEHEVRRLSGFVIRSHPEGRGAPFGEDQTLSEAILEWFEKVRAFRQKELGYLCESNSPHVASQAHRAVISHLIWAGEHYLEALGTPGGIAGKEFGANDIRSEIESLGATLRGVHGPHNHAETTKRILEILSVP
jgi:hypothetical protein